MIKYVSGYCPYKDDTHTIEAEYQEVKITHTLNRNYQLVGYSCSLSSECPRKFKDEYGRCSLVIEASQCN